MLEVDEMTSILEQLLDPLRKVGLRRDVEHGAVDVAVGV